MENLPKRTYKTKDICGMSKHDLFQQLQHAFSNYRLKTAIEATTYIHYLGYDREWWDLVLNFTLKQLHINFYGHFEKLLKFYQEYQELKAREQSICTNRRIGWHMCYISALVATLDKTPILSQKQLKAMPFMHFAMHEGTARPAKLRLVHEHILNCIEDAINTSDLTEITLLTHYLLREDYGHNKYVPLFFDKLSENTTIHKAAEIKCLKELYKEIMGNKRYLCILLAAYIYCVDNPNIVELGRFEEQANYYYQRNLRNLQIKQNNLQMKQNNIPIKQNNLQTQHYSQTQHDNMPIKQNNLQTHIHEDKDIHDIKQNNDILDFVFEPIETANETVSEIEIDDTKEFLEPIEPEQQINNGRKSLIKIIKM